MHRDWDLIRNILARIEALPNTQSVLSPDDVPGVPAETVSYHINILMDAGLIEGNCSKSINAPMHCWANQLTWAGHEFLDEIRSDTTWNRAKTLLRDKGVALSFETIKAAVEVLLKQILT